MFFKSTEPHSGDSFPKTQYVNCPKTQVIEKKNDSYLTSFFHTNFKNQNFQKFRSNCALHYPPYISKDVPEYQKTNFVILGGIKTRMKLVGSYEVLSLTNFFLHLSDQNFYRSEQQKILPMSLFSKEVIPVNLLPFLYILRATIS